MRQSGDHAVMPTQVSMTRLDRPWHQPGAAWYAVRRLPGLLRYLRRHDVPAPPRVRLEVRESRDVITSVREEDSWPLDRTEWRPLYLTAAGLAAGAHRAAGRVAPRAGQEGDAARPRRAVHAPTIG
jgi:predicted acyl esterase